MTSQKLTSQQQSFLSDYLQDIIDSKDDSFAKCDDTDFVSCVSGMEFDSEINYTDCRIAKNLNKKGLFSYFFICYDSIFGVYIQFSFSEVGALTLSRMRH